MSTQATTTTDVSAGESNAGKQSLLLASRGTAGGGSRTIAAGTVLPVAGEHVPIIHLTTLLPAPIGEVTKVFQGVTFEDQHNQATDIYEFLNTPSPVLPRLNGGSECYADLVNVTNTYLVKLIYCIGMGSIPIGENTSPVDGEVLFLQGNGNADLGPPQMVCLPDTVV